MALVWALCFVLAFFHSAVAREYLVGGRKGWVVPSGGEPETYQQWSSRNRFLIGDTLLFKYNPAEDSVVQVSQHHYDTCNKSRPIASYKGGNTVFTLSQPGPFRFISGNRSNCQKGEKLTVVVITPRNRSHGAPPPTAASPGPSVIAPSPSSIPAPAPTTKTPSSIPAPAPTTKTPSSIPAPAPAPTTKTPSSSPSPAPLVGAPSPSSSPAPLLSAPSPSPVSPTLSPPSPLTATPSSSTPSSLPSQSTATPSSSSPTPPASASPPALVPALNLVIPLLFALKILTIY